MNIDKFLNLVLVTENPDDIFGRAGAKTFGIYKDFIFYFKDSRATHGNAFRVLKNKLYPEYPVDKKMVSNLEIMGEIPKEITDYIKHWNDKNSESVDFMYRDKMLSIHGIKLGRIDLESEVISFWHNSHNFSPQDKNSVLKLCALLGANPTQYTYEFFINYEKDVRLSYNEFFGKPIIVPQKAESIDTSRIIHIIDPTIKGDVMKKAGIKPKAIKGVQKRFAMGESTNFSTFFEARQEFVDKIKSSVDDISKRPFDELFKGKERFAIKVPNPDFAISIRHLGLSLEDFDYNKWTYKGTNINTFFKNKWSDGELVKYFSKEWGLDKDDAEHFRKELSDKNTRKKLIGGEFELNELFKHIRGIKRILDQNNMFYYVVFTRHPIDVLRMSDHRGISSCHRLGGGKYSPDEGIYQDCAFADAKNDGGVVYLIRGGDFKKIKDQLNDPEIFEDIDRGTGKIRPIGRIRLRRFIDMSSKKDFAVPTTIQGDQKYGRFTPEIHEVVLNYLRRNQQIFKNPPTEEYAEEHIVMVGGSYSDENISNLLELFFGEERVSYSGIKHSSGHTTTWQEEIDNILPIINDAMGPYIRVTPTISRNAWDHQILRIHLAVFLSVPINLEVHSRKDIDSAVDDIHHDYRVIRRILPLSWNNLNSYIAGSIREYGGWNNQNGGQLWTSIEFNILDPDSLHQMYVEMLSARTAIATTEKIITQQIHKLLDALKEDSPHDPDK
jgi:hypothetical protein